MKKNKEAFFDEEDWREVFFGCLVGGVIGSLIVVIGAIEGAVGPVTGRPVTWEKAGLSVLSNLIGLLLYRLAANESNRRGDE